MSVYMLDKFQSGKIAGLKGLGFFGLILFWLLPWHAEGPGPGIEPKPQQWPKLLQWQHQILNWLCHKGTPKGLCLHGPCPQRPCVGLPSPPCFTSPNCEGGQGCTGQESKRWWGSLDHRGGPLSDEDCFLSAVLGPPASAAPVAVTQ